MHRLVALAAAALLLAGPALVQTPALAQPPALAQSGAEWAETVRLRAQLLTVDREAGQFLMRDLETRAVFVHEPPTRDAGMLGVEPGDVVSAMLTRRVSVRPAEPGDTAATESELLRVQTEAGDRPGFLGGQFTRSVITLTGWDAEAGIAHGATPEGEALAYAVKTPEGRAFLAAQPIGALLEVEMSQTVSVIKE